MSRVTHNYEINPIHFTFSNLKASISLLAFDAKITRNHKEKLTREI